MAAIVVHAGALLGDSFMSPSLADITLPFASSFHRFWTTLGILCGWGTLILGLSYYARARIGVQRWRRLHRLTAVVWLVSIAHALGEGSDAGEAWFLLGAGALVLLSWSAILEATRHSVAAAAGGVAAALLLGLIGAALVYASRERAAGVVTS